MVKHRHVSPQMAQQTQRHWQEGVAHAKEKRWKEAAAAFEAARQRDPGDAVVLLNLARACLELGRHHDVVTYTREARRLAGASELAALLEVRALSRLQRHAEARACLEALPASLRTSHEYWSCHGAALKSLNELKLAVTSFMKALSIKVDDAKTHYNLGLCFFEMGLKEEACECYRTGLMLGLEENTLHALGMLTFAERENCLWAEATEHLRKLHEVVEHLPANVAVQATMFAHVTLSDDPLHQLKVARLMGNTWRHLHHVERAAASRPAGRVRVGYVSGDFHHHATCVLMAEVFEHHDRERFEVFAYSHGPDDASVMRRRVQLSIEHFVDVRALSDQQIAQRIAEDGIDILIDLKGHTAQNRLGIFAYRPAPVQTTFLGFPGTTGTSEMDYIIGDPMVTPLAHAAHFSEAIAQMPVCYQPNDRQRPLPRLMQRADVGLPKDAVVLCGFNQPYKISSEVMDVWCGLLNDLPDAVLWLLDWHSQARPNLEREFQERGVDLTRVHWAPRLDLGDHLSRLSLADIFIDTWPCNGHTTASDALWAGVPVVTLSGATFASRVASSLLHAVGLDELICERVDVYQDTIKALAHDPMRRAVLRDKLVWARESAPLFDSARFTRDYESLLVRMHSRQIQGLSPQPLAAETVEAV